MKKINFKEQSPGTALPNIPTPFFKIYLARIYLAPGHGFFWSIFVTFNLLHMYTWYIIGHGIMIFPKICVDVLNYLPSTGIMWQNCMVQNLRAPYLKLISMFLYIAYLFLQISVSDVSFCKYMSVHSSYWTMSRKKPTPWIA